MVRYINRQVDDEQMNRQIKIENQGIYRNKEEMNDTTIDLFDDKEFNISKLQIIYLC